MSHVRQQIRESVAAALTGLVTTGTRVFQSRLRPLKDTDLPCLLVNTDDEEIETVGVNQHATQERTLKVNVRCIAKQSATLDDALDTMLAEVETALSSKEMLLESISIEMNDELEKPVGVATANYRLTYYTATGTPGVAL